MWEGGEAMTESQFQVWLLEHGYAVWLQKFMFAAVMSRCVRDEMPQAVVQAFGCPVQAMGMEMDVGDLQEEYGTLDDLDKSGKFGSKPEKSADKKGKKRAPKTQTLTDSPTKKPKGAAPLSPRKPSRVQVPAGDFMATRSSPVKQRFSSRGANKVPDPCRSSTHDQNVCMLLTCTANNCDREHACNNRMQREWASPRRAPWIAPDAHAQHHVRVCMLQACP